MKIFLERQNEVGGGDFPHKNEGLMQIHFLYFFSIKLSVNKYSNHFLIIAI